MRGSDHVRVFVGEGGRGVVLGSRSAPQDGLVRDGRHMWTLTEVVACLHAAPPCRLNEVCDKDKR